MFTPYAAPITALLPVLGGALAATFDAPTTIVVKGRTGGHVSLVTLQIAASISALYAEPLPAHKPRIDKLTPPPGVPTCALVFYPTRRPGWLSTVAVDGLVAIPGVDAPLPLSHGALLMDGPRVWLAASDSDVAIVIDETGLHHRSQNDVPGMRGGDGPLARPWWRDPPVR